MARSRNRSMDPKSLANDVARITDARHDDPDRAKDAALRLLLDVVAAGTGPKVNSAVAPLAQVLGPR